MRFVLLLTALTACDAQETKAFNQNDSRSNRSLAILSQPSSVLPMSAASAIEPSCVEVQLLAGDDEPDGRAPGDPIPGLDVKLGCQKAGLLASATTDDGGIATFCDLSFEKRGAFVLLADAEGADAVLTEPVLVVRAPRFIEWVRQPADGHVGVALRSADGGCPAVRVRAGEVMPGGENGSSDAVAYRAGDPIHGVDVKLGLAMGGAVVASATTDSDGVASFCDLSPSAAGAVAYEPWTLEDVDQGVVSNPLYEQSGNGGVNPLFEGRNARSRATYVGDSSYVVRFSRQPPPKMVSGVALPAESCPMVTVSHAAGFSPAAPLDALPGEPAAGLSVTFTAVPDGGSIEVVTNADGQAALCSPALGALDGAYNLEATVSGARPALSWAVSFSSP